jgi:hypothetical protein
MIFFGHLGMGLGLTRPFFRLWGRPLKLVPFFVGTVLPDLLDKSLYYGLSTLTGKAGLALGLISGTRTFGHTFLLAFIILFLGWRLKSLSLIALAVGACTHIALDQFMDSVNYQLWPEGTTLQFNDHGIPLTTVGVFWPFLGNRFPYAEFQNLGEHVRWLFRPGLLGAEVIGIALLLLDSELRKKLKQVFRK